jgi:hypothetical protein
MQKASLYPLQLFHKPKQQKFFSPADSPTDSEVNFAVDSAADSRLKL